MNPHILLLSCIKKTTSRLQFLYGKAFYLDCMERLNLLPNQSAHYFPVTTIDFSKCYKVQRLRIARGFSDRDLSFLLGYKENDLFVRKVENPLHSKRYKAKDTNYLLHIFECELPIVMDGKLPQLKYDLQVIETVNPKRTKSFDIFIRQSNRKWKLFHSHTELARDGLVLPNSEVNVMEIKQYLIALLGSDFLSSPKTGLELFRKCTEHFKKHFKPIFIASAINEINVDETKAKIEIGQNGMRRLTYTKVQCNTVCP